MVYFLFLIYRWIDYSKTQPPPYVANEEDSGYSKEYICCGCQRKERSFNSKRDLYDHISSCKGFPSLKNSAANIKHIAKDEHDRARISEVRKSTSKNQKTRQRSQKYEQPSFDVSKYQLTPSMQLIRVESLHYLSHSFIFMV